MPSRRSSRLGSESGQGIIEYTLILALASLGMVLALLVLQGSVGGTLLGTSHRIDAVTAGAAGPAGQLLPGDPVGTGSETGASSPAGPSDGGSYGRGHGMGSGGYVHGETSGK